MQVQYIRPGTQIHSRGSFTVTGDRSQDRAREALGSKASLQDALSECYLCHNIVPWGEISSDEELKETRQRALFSHQEV